MKHPFLVKKTGEDSGWHVMGRPLGLALVILYKGVWGLLEILAGIFLCYSARLITRELTNDPQDLFVKWFLHYVHWKPGTVTHVGIVVILLGVGKVATAVGLWYRSFFIRNIGMVVLAIFAFFAIISLFTKFSFFRLGALAIDLLIFYYFWKILPKHMRHEKIV